jgi:hypothetical protein
MTELHQGLAPVEFSEPEPYSGGRLLRVPGEIDYCETAAGANDDSDRCRSDEDDEEDEEEDEDDEDDDD